MPEIKLQFKGNSLVQDDEANFQAWYAVQSKKTGMDSNPDAPEHKYDYRAAYRAGVEPGADGHWDSRFKAPDHPNRFVGGIDTITGEKIGEDDISSTYTLGRQVAHEYHSSAVQRYIEAESAAQQVAQEAAMTEMDQFKKEQAKKKADETGAVDTFASTMMESLATRKPEATSSIGERGEQVAPDGGGGGWSDETAPEAMPSESKKIQAETSSQVEDPMIDPVMAASAGAGAAFKLSMSAGKALMPSLAAAARAGLVNAAMEPAYGTAAEVVGANNPALALPFNVLAGIGGGMTFEPMLERAISRASAKIGKAIDPALMRQVLANEAGMVEVWHGSPHKFDKMSLEKIGTGEGEQAFGHGLYFTDKKDIAAHYSKADPYLIQPPRSTFLGKELEQGTPEYHAATLMETTGKTLAGVKNEVRGWIKNAKPGENVDHYESVLKTLESATGKKDFGVLKPAENLYRAQLFPGKDPSEYTFLDWYEKLPKENATKILKGLRQEGVIDYKEFDKAIKEGITGEDLYKWLSGTDLGKEKIKLRKEWEAAQKRRDWDTYEKKYLEWEELETSKYPQKDASLFLKRAGIDGIRYPTETLSGKGPKGGDAFNYVVFDDKDIKLVSRESGGVVDDLTKAAVVEELNKEIKNLSVADILKSQKGELVVRQGPEAPAPVKGGSKKSGVPAPPDMKAKAAEVSANTNLDITQEYAGNIRLWGGADLEPKFLGQIETPEDIMRIVKGTDEAFAAEREIARGGKISWDKSEEMSKDKGLEDLLGRRHGQALAHDEILNARKLLVSSSETLRGMSKVIQAGTATDIEKLDFMRAFNTHYAIQMQLSGAAAEAGRALQIFRKVAQSDAIKMGQIREFMQGSAGKVAPEMLAKAISEMETPAQVANFVKQATRATSWDMFIEAWINGLLSGPVTHAVNMTSNALTSVWMIPERALAAGISQLHGGEIRGGEVAAQSFGLVQGFKDGLKLAWEALKKGESSDLMGKIENQTNRAITAENVRQLPLVSKLAPNALEEGGIAARAVDMLGEGIRIPGRMLTASDELFKSVGYRMELQAQAYRKAASEGLEGTAMATRIREIVSNPQELAPEVQLAAINAARYQTFTSELGEGGRAVQTAANKVPGVKLIVPFIRTPTNILKFAMERTPLAPIMKSVRADILAGGARRDMALARISLGSMAMAVTASYAADGTITGGGPSDPALKSHLYNQGWQPYSIKVNGKYYGYGRLEPIGMMMGLAADAVEIMGEVDELEGSKIASTIVAAIAKNVTSKTWLRGLSEFVAAMDDPDRYGDKYIQQFIGTAVPTGVAQIERTISPEVSDVQGWMDKLKSRIPGFSDELPTRRNLWGEKITFNGSLGPDIVSPIFTSTEKDSKIDKELIRMKTPIRMPQRKQSIQGVTVPLDGYEYEEFVVRMNNIKIESTGKTLKKSLDYLVTKDRDYKSARDDDQRERMIKSYMNEAIEKTRNEMYETNPEIRRFIDDEHRRMAAVQ